ncbi:hypothetical protein [Siphonobacter sp.]|uniref:hypothetical protein n=1 Tax=Siphonobacter sp. TaxID=1869184 RepID=UPI003B3BCBEF
MKKLIFTLLIGAMVLPEYASASSSSPSAGTTVQTEQAHARKRRSYRKKKGFMWGLFRKKDKGCGCPSYK